MKILQVKMAPIISTFSSLTLKAGVIWIQKLRLIWDGGAIFNHNTLIGFTLTRLISIQVTFDPDNKSINFDSSSFLTSNIAGYHLYFLAQVIPGLGSSLDTELRPGSRRVRAPAMARPPPASDCDHWPGLTWWHWPWVSCHVQCPVISLCCKPVTRQRLINQGVFINRSTFVAHS